MAKRPTQKLQCEMTAEEKAEIGTKLAEKQLEREKALDLKREEVSKHNAVIRGIDGEMHTLAMAQTTGTIEREVEIRLEPDWNKRLVRVLRCDTDEQIDVRDMSPGEIQGRLAFFGLMAGVDKGTRVVAAGDKFIARVAEHSERVTADVEAASSRIVFEEHKGEAGPYYSAKLEYEVDGKQVIFDGEGPDKFEARDAVVEKLIDHLLDKYIAEDKRAKAEAKAAAKKKGGAKGEGASPPPADGAPTS